MYSRRDFNQEGNFKGQFLFAGIVSCQRGGKGQLRKDGPVVRIVKSVKKTEDWSCRGSGYRVEDSLEGTANMP